MYARRGIEIIYIKSRLLLQRERRGLAVVKKNCKHDFFIIRANDGNNDNIGSGFRRLVRVHIGRSRVSKSFKENQKSVVVGFSRGIKIVFSPNVTPKELIRSTRQYGTFLRL